MVGKVQAQGQLHLPVLSYTHIPRQQEQQLPWLHGKHFLMIIFISVM